MSLSEQDTIVALSTPPGMSAIAVIRLTGENSLERIKEIYSGKIEAGKVNHGFINLEKDFSDEVVLLYFKKPNSYTGEDLIEIHTHGNMLIVENILRYLYSKGIRAALPGEFTKRAFLNGKMDLIQAEALEMLIKSSTYDGIKLSFSYLKGGLSKKVEEIRESILVLLSQIEANIDFPDYDVEIDWKSFNKTVKRIKEWTIKILNSSHFSNSLFEGQNIIVAGKANVGKSSLLNAFVQEERALVSEYPGTTRDFLRERIVYRNKAFNVIDIAGIEERENRLLEKRGIERSLKILEENDNILFVIDASEGVDERDFSVYDKIKGKKIILVLNKIDKGSVIEKREAEKLFPEVLDIIEISAKFEKNIDELLDKMIFYYSNEKNKSDFIAMTERQKELFYRLKDEAERVLEKKKLNYEEEILAEHVREMKRIVEKLTGKIYDEEILEKIFSSFCIGK